MIAQQVYGWIVLIGGGFATIAAAELLAWAAPRLRHWRARKPVR